uniref:F-box domain-containing protein n=3 Tax=Bionectria ochroleuca TaxID=29856 RepID=A0A0B7K614_BIOOC
MGRSSAMKSRAKSKAPHQPLPDALHDRLSSLPMEILEMIVENITDSSAMGKLSRTSKIYYSLAAPRLHRRMVVLEAYHSRLLKMARALDSHLTIAQKRQLEKKVDKYRSHQERYPDLINQHQVPQCASFVRQLIVGSFSLGEEHEEIVNQYLGHALDHWENLEIVDVGFLTRPISEKIASLERLKALSISTNAFSETAIKPLAEIQGLQHLSMIEMDSYQLTPGESVLASLIRNSRPTLKSLRVIGIGYTTSFLNHLRETVPTSRGSANAQHHIFSALKSLTLEDTTLDTEVIRHLKNSVDFLGLDELEVRRVAGASELFFNTLTKMAVTTSHIRLHTLFLTLSSVKNDETDEELQQPATVTQLHKPLIKMKCQFISAFNTLTSLEIHNDSRHMIDTTADPVIEGQVLQAITQHKGLKMLKISFGELISNRRVSYLSARSVSALVNNLPHLEEIEFAPEENEIEDIGIALSHAAKLRVITCYPHHSQRRFPFNPTSGRIILDGVIKGFLSRGGEDSDEGEFVWEDYFKLASISVKYQMWDIGSNLGRTRRGMKKAETLVSTDGEREVMFREVRGLKRPFSIPLGYDPEYTWVNKVAMDIDCT